MKEIYQVTIRGRKFESRDLRQLLARAVHEKKNLDERLRKALCGQGYSGCPGQPAVAVSASGAMR